MGSMGWDMFSRARLLENSTKMRVDIGARSWAVRALGAAPWLDKIRRNAKYLRAGLLVNAVEYRSYLGVWNWLRLRPAAPRSICFSRASRGRGFVLWCSLISRMDCRCNRAPHSYYPR